MTGGDPAAASLLDTPAACVARRSLLVAPHARPLALHAAALRAARGGAHVPDFDPLDGGTRARVLLLLETPGPAIRDTGFVSRDNPTPTARNLRRFLAEAGLARDATAIWNAVPWTVHAPGARNRALRPAEIREGIALLPGLLALLPALRVAVLAGHVARAAHAVVERCRPGLVVLPMPHPSPTIVCTDPAIAVRIRETLHAARHAGAGPVVAGG